MSDTATTAGAREHARAQQAAAAKVVAKPTIPIGTATKLPPGVVLSDLLWDETLAIGDYAARILERGSRLRIIDDAGDACANLLVYNADCPTERLNVADTVKVQWQAYLGEGALLLSDMGRVLMSITRDTCGRHDTFCGASSLKSNAAKYGDGSNYGRFPNARDRFSLALTKFGLGRRDVTHNINLFRRIEVSPDGQLQWVTADDRPGQFVELRAEMRVLVVCVNTPHVLDPRPHYDSGNIRVVAYRSMLTPVDDPIRISSPERLRAFDNVDDYYNVGR